MADARLTLPRILIWNSSQQIPILVFVVDDLVVLVVAATAVGISSRAAKHLRIFTFNLPWLSLSLHFIFKAPDL